MYIVSRCLLGEPCKYNGGHNRNPAVIAFCRTHSHVALCPECAGGLTAPRPPAEQRLLRQLDGTEQRRVLDREGRDLTEAFCLGAKRCFQAARQAAEAAGESLEGAILKANSPSCGVGRIYDGSFSGSTSAGDGIFAALLRAEGIPLETEQTYKADS